VNAIREFTHSPIHQLQRPSMSKHNNVNPDYYKVAGRERQGHAVAKAPKQLAEQDKARQARETRERWHRSQRKADAKRQKSDVRTGSKY
jgi:hypothetical protein